MSESNFLYLPPNPSPTIETPTAISPPPPHTDVNQETPPPPVANQATPSPQTGVNQATPPPPIDYQTTPPPPITSQPTPPPPIVSRATTPPPVVSRATPPPPVANETTPPPPTSNQAPSPPIENQEPPPPLANQATSPSLIANHVPPPPSIVNQATPPPLITNQETPPPYITKKATPPPFIVKQETPPPSIANQVTPSPPDTTNFMPPTSEANQLAPPSPNLIQLTPPPVIDNQLNPPSDATQLISPPPSAMHMTPPPLNAKLFEPELTAKKQAPKPFLSNLISNKLKTPPPGLSPSNTSPLPPKTESNTVLVSVQIPPSDSVQELPVVLSPPSITTFEPLQESIPSPPPPAPVDSLPTLVPTSVPVASQVQFPPPHPFFLPPPGFSNPTLSPPSNLDDTSSAPHVHVEPSTTQDSSTSEPTHDTLHSTMAIVGITIIASFIFVFLMYLLVIGVKSLRRRQGIKNFSIFKTKKSSAGQVSSINMNTNGGFSYKQLFDMTAGFSDANIIGEGGFAHVYKGLLPNGTEVAVKQIKKEKATAQELRLEMEIIGRIHHRHLVKFLGYCLTESHQLLVYEFVPNKTLSYHLHDGAPVLDWQKRMRIAIGSARCLKYLHEDCEPKIVHRDIKSANILLDDSFEPKLADFGLAKLRHDDNTHVSTRVMGTYGYLAPEYAITGQLTFKSDVFSFGVVLLEIITGRRAINPSDPEESLVGWAWPLLVEAIKNENFETLVDPKLEGNYIEKEMCQIVHVAAGCVRHSAANRLSMPQVLKALESGCNLSDLWNGVRFGDSTTFDSRQYSLEISSFQNREFGDASGSIKNS